MSRNILLLLGVLLVGSAAWLVDAMQLSPRVAFHERDGERIDALLASRAAFEVSVLEARAGLQSSFDPINRAIAAQRDAISLAEALKARGAVYAAVAAQVGLAARALETDEPVLEQFKTDLTLLRLSTHYFPLAADALRRRAEADVKRAKQSPLAGRLGTLAALRADMERYEELPAQETEQRLEQGLTRLQTVRASLDDDAREDLDVLSGHTRALLDRRQRVDRAARSLVRSPVRVYLEAAGAAYERSARSHAQRVGALQVLSGVLALGGVIILASVVLRSVRGRAR